MNRQLHFYRLMVGAILAIFIFTGCVPSTFRTNGSLMRRDSAQKILIMPMDIELSTLTAGGVLKPEAAWTEKAKMNVEGAIRTKMSSMNIQPFSEKELQSTPVSLEESQKYVQIMKLHEAVGKAIMIHQYIPELKLPNKQEKFDWTIGRESRFLKEKYDVDYALFVYMRDSYASAGRVGTMLLAAAFGVSMPLGQQLGFASLVDLETGEVVWFNRLFREVGDLRTEADAASSVGILLAGLPR